MVGRVIVICIGWLVGMVILEIIVEGVTGNATAGHVVYWVGLAGLPAYGLWRWVQRKRAARD